jgi:hypothetical protein
VERRRAGVARRPARRDLLDWFDEPEGVEEPRGLVVFHVHGSDSKDPEPLQVLAGQELVAVPPRRDDRVERRRVGWVAVLESETEAEAATARRRDWRE